MLERFRLIQSFALQNMGKGSLWKVEQQYRQVLMQALTRSPYHQFAGTMDKTGGSFSDESLGPDTNNNVLMCNSSPSSSNISSTSSSLSTSPTGMEPHHHHSHNHTHNHQGALKNGKGRPFDPVLFPYLSKEISKLDSNNNALCRRWCLGSVRMSRFKLTSPLKTFQMQTTTT